MAYGISQVGFQGYHETVRLAVGGSSGKSGKLWSRVASLANLSACYYRAPPIDGVDGNDTAGAGADACDDSVAIVTGVWRAAAVEVVSGEVEHAASITVRRIALMIFVFIGSYRYVCFVRTLSCSIYLYRIGKLLFPAGDMAVRAPLGGSSIRQRLVGDNGIKTVWCWLY